MLEFSEPARDVLTRIGLALLLVQSTEQVIQTCMTYALPADCALTLEKLEREIAQKRKKPLGQFLTALRQRADLDDDFDAILKEFLEMRNTLVHRLDELDEVWSLEKESGLREARQFVGRLLELNQIVLTVFLALLRTWQIEVKLNIEAPEEIFREPPEYYASLANSIFFKKK
jgi:hypothetical protein